MARPVLAEYTIRILAPEGADDATMDRALACVEATVEHADRLADLIRDEFFGADALAGFDLSIDNPAWDGLFAERAA